MDNIFSRHEFMSKKLNEKILSGDEILLKKVDYTLLKPEATEEDIIELCEKADMLGVKSVCVLPKMVKTAAYALKRSDVLVCTVISFPHGTDSSYQKLEECRKAIMDGADECDMVLNYPLLKNIDTDYDNIIQKLINDVALLVDECHKRSNKDDDPVTLKVIVESGLLDKEQTLLSTQICLEAGADFIKTSTGMVAVGAELEKVQIMKQEIEKNNLPMKIKASGGLRTLADLQKFNPLVDRFGVGFAAIDKIFGEGGESVGNY
jgi:deoxyribose-phosphate aldolase